MTLQAEVISRVSVQKLKNITNPDAAGATTYDSGRLDLACSDALGELATKGIIFDLANIQHVRLGVLIVIAILAENGGASTEVAEKIRKRADDMMEKVALTGPRDRVLPTSRNELTPTPDQQFSGEVVRPDFDRSFFTDLIPENPRTGSNGPVE